MSFTVLTLTRGDRPKWLKECRESVAAAMPAGGRHKIVECPVGSDFQRTRFDSIQECGGVVALVDDDDIVLNDSLQLCFNALDKVSAGLAFTNECRMDAIGGLMPAELTKPRTTHDIASHPSMAHHLCVVRASCVDEDALRAAQAIGIGVDWLIRASAGLRHGAVHVPVVGYGWRYHSKQESATFAFSSEYQAKMDALRAVTRSWMKYSTPVPRYEE